MPHIMRGRLVTAPNKPIGDTLVEPAAAGALQLQVGDTFPFEEDGGQLRLGVQVLTYTGYDDDTATIFLDSPTEVDALEGDDVVRLPEIFEKTIQVRVATDSGSRPVTVGVPFYMHPMIDEAIRSSAEEPVVTLREVGGEYEIVDLYGTPKTVDAGALTGELPDDIKDQISGGPSEAPGSAPGLEVAPFAVGTVRATITPVDPALQATYEVAASLTSPVAEDGSATVGTVRGTVFDIATLDGEQVPFTEPTFVKVRAVNAIGAGPWSEEASATPRQADSDYISALYAYLGKIEVNQLVSGQLDAVVALLGRLSVGDLIDVAPPSSEPDGSGGFLLSGGITIADPDNPEGEPLVRLHPMGCTFKGKLTADIITILYDLVINGNASISGGSTMTWRNGVPDPLEGPKWNIAPEVAQPWPFNPTSYNAGGSVWDGLNSRWIQLLTNPSTSRGYIRSIDIAGVVSGAPVLLPRDLPSGSTDSGFVYGLAWTPGVVHYTWRSSAERWFLVSVPIGSGLSATGPIKQTEITGLGIGGLAPGLTANDAGELVVAAWEEGTVKRLRVYSPTTHALLRSAEAPEWHVPFLVGSFDFGSERVVAFDGPTETVRVYSINWTSGELTEDPSKAWVTPSRGQYLSNLAWDGAHFITGVPGDTTLKKWSGHYPDSDSSVWSAVYADRTNGGTTKASPSRSATVPARNFATLTLGPPPDGAIGSDVWVGYSASGDAPTKYKRTEGLSGRTMRLLGKSTTGSTAIPTESTAGGSPAVARSGAADGWTLSGDGTARTTRAATVDADIVNLGTLKNRIEAIPEPESPDWSPWEDISSKTRSGVSGLVEIARRGQDRLIRGNVSSSWIANESKDIILTGGIDAGDRPTATAFDFAYMQGARPGTAFIRTVGSIAVANMANETRSTAQFTLKYTVH